MKHLSSILRFVAVLSAVIVMVSAAEAATTFLWNVPVPGANPWNINANWLPATGYPGSADTALFGVTGTAASSTTVNNVVSVSTAISGLTYTNNTSGTWHVTQIPDGVTLSTSGNVSVGGGLGNTFVTSAAMVGGGTFQASGNTFVIGNQGSSMLASATILDLSGLSNFVYNASAGVIGMGVANRSIAGLTLAAGSNYLTAATINLNTGSSSASGGPSSLSFGAGTNVINVGAINIGANRTAGTATFASSTGGLRLRGTAGGDADRVTTVVLGNRNTGSSTVGQTTGTINLNGHPVDARIATLTLGQNSQTANTNLSGIGVFQFDQGIVDISSVNMGVCGGNSSTLNLTNGAIGTLTVGANGTLLVSSVSLANVTSTALGSFANGTLNVFGGTAICTNSILKTTSGLSTGTVAVATSGTLYVQGQLGSQANPIDNLNITNATFRVNVDATSAITTNAIVKTVNAGGTTTIDIARVTGVTGPVTIPLIGYTTLNGSVAGKFTVTCPGDYIAALVGNSAQNRIDLSITPTVIIVPLVWTGATNGDWDTATTNWTSSGALATYTDASVVVFDDSAWNTWVNLTASLSPASMVMSNSIYGYFFIGPGSLAGTNSLTLKGGQTMVLDNSGSNSFTGGTFIWFGTLQVGNGDTAGNLPAGTSVTDNGALVYNRTDSVTVDNPISGAGTLTQSGAGTLTLAGANSYGATTISSGTLQVGAGTANGSLGSGSVLNNGTLSFNRTDPVTVTNVISGSGAVTKLNNNTLTLTGANTFGGGLVANGGTVRLNTADNGGSGAVTANPGGIIVFGAGQTDSGIILAGGTFGSSLNLNPLVDDLTAAAGTSSTLFMADPQNLTAPTDGNELNFTGTWHGSGNVVVLTVPNDASADSGNGFRLRGTALSDYSGTLTLSNKVKCELQTVVAGPFSPAGTGKLVLYGGVLTNNTVNGTYSEINLRNQSADSTVLGNDVEMAGLGIAVVNPLGTAPSGASVTMGNLKIGAGQELGVNVNGTASPPINHPVVFPTVTLNGGNATFSPKTSGWNTAPQWGSDLSLGTISELVPGSGFTMTGLNSLFLTGSSANTYSGPTTNASGTLVLSKTSGNAILGLLVITGGIVTNAASDQIADSAAVIINGGSWALGLASETVGPVSLLSGSITGPGTLQGAGYDLQNGPVSAILGGPAALTKSTANTVTLSAANTYTGATLVNAGTLALVDTGSIPNSATITLAAGATLDASARADGTLTLGSGQTLTGNGAINGSLLVAAGATVSPGASIGALTVSNAVALHGTTVMELGTGTNDVITSMASIAYGGMLSLVFTPGTLTPGSSFKLFSATNYSDSFSSLNPTTPGAGLAWDSSQLATNGTLRVASTVNPTPTNLTAVVSGNQLTLSWPADHLGWWLQTNAVNVGLTNFWFTFPGSAATDRVDIAIDQAGTNVFYRMALPTPY